MSGIYKNTSYLRSKNISPVVYVFRFAECNNKRRWRGSSLFFHFGVLQSCQLCMNEGSAHLFISVLFSVCHCH